jgi:16S rRNA (guanine527-N7)-methyltransferase
MWGLGREEFGQGIARVAPEELTVLAVDAMYGHYLELGRWNERLGLIGRGTVEDLMVRHYGEALAALPMISSSARIAVDLGSGGGFPGLVVAAARPGLRMTLVEARERKWAYLASAVRKAALPCKCLNARVANPLPAGLPETIDLVTVRALKLGTEVLGALARRLAPNGEVLLWAGEQTPDLPRELAVITSLRLAGGERRRIVRLRRADPANREPEHP